MSYTLGLVAAQQPRTMDEGYADPQLAQPSGERESTQPSGGYGPPIGGAQVDLPGDPGLTQPSMDQPTGQSGPLEQPSKMNTYLMIAGVAILILFFIKK